VLGVMGAEVDMLGKREGIKKFKKNYGKRSGKFINVDIKISSDKELGRRSGQVIQ